MLKLNFRANIVVLAGFSNPSCSRSESTPLFSPFPPLISAIYEFLGKALISDLSTYLRLFRLFSTFFQFCSKNSGKKLGFVGIFLRAIFLPHKRRRQNSSFQDFSVSYFHKKILMNWIKKPATLKTLTLEREIHVAFTKENSYFC